MAIISCPECGGKMSDTSKQCIHCGCTVTLCPECRKALTPNVAVCPECGYSFDMAPKEISEEITEDSPQNDVPAITTIYSDWKEHSSAYKFFKSKGLKLFGRIFSWVNLAVFLLSVAFIKIDFISVLLLLSYIIIPTVISLIPEDMIITSSLANWLTVKKIDVKESISATLNEDHISLTKDEIETRREAIDAVVKATAHNNIPNIKLLNYAAMALDIICAPFQTISCAIILWSLIDNFNFLDAITNNPIASIVLIATFVVGFIVAFILDTYGNTHQNEWLKNTIPEHYPTYLKFYKG